MIYPRSAVDTSRGAGAAGGGAGGGGGASLAVRVGPYLYYPHMGISPPERGYHTREDTPDFSCNVHARPGISPGVPSGGVPDNCKLAALKPPPPAPTAPLAPLPSPLRFPGPFEPNTQHVWTREARLVPWTLSGRSR